MNIRMIPLHEIRPYENNVRQHPVRQLESIVQSIRTFGFRQPLVLDKNNIIVCGHARYEAACTIPLDYVPCEMADDLTKQQINAYGILDNEIAAQGYTDQSLLQIEMDKIPEFDFTPFNLELPDFNITNDGLCDEDEVPEAAEEAITKRGDIWILGNHRLMCGDSTVFTDVVQLMNSINPILMVTDPPYGVNYNPEWREGCDLGIGKRSKGKVINDNKIDWTDAYVLFPGNVVYIWHAGKYSAEVAMHLRNCEFDIVSQIIWVKQHFALSRGDYHWQHEPCWYAVRKGNQHNWQGARDQSTTWEIKNNNSFGNSSKEETWGHGTQKPVECMARPIINNTSDGDYIYDPFGGSGTSIIAAEKHNRKCFMMEISENYCDIIVKRWQKFTGNDAILESTGIKFDEVENGRTT